MTSPGHGSGSRILARDGAPTLASDWARLLQADGTVAGAADGETSQELLRRAHQALELGQMEDARSAAVLLLGRARQTEPRA